MKKLTDHSYVLGLGDGQTYPLYIMVVWKHITIVNTITIVLNAIESSARGQLLQCLCDYVHNKFTSVH